MKYYGFLLLLTCCIACTKSKDRSYVICGHLSDTSGIAFSNSGFRVTAGNFMAAPAFEVFAEFTTDSSGDFCFMIDKAKTKKGLCLVQSVQPFSISGRIDLPATTNDTIKLGNRTIKP